MATTATAAPTPQGGDEQQQEGGPETAAPMEGVEPHDLPHVLRNLHLRKIIKENHLKAIETLVFSPTHRNLIATAGGGIVSLYDNDHCGGHLDLSCVFYNDRTEWARGGLVTELEWIPASDSLHNDALLAFAGASGEVSVLSVCHTRVVALLQGHQKAVTALVALPQREGLFASSARDGTVRIWDALAASSGLGFAPGFAPRRPPSPECLAVLAQPQSAAAICAMAVVGGALVIGMADGSVRAAELDLSAVAARSVAPESSEPLESRVVLAADKRRGAIYCIRALSETRLAVLGADGRLIVCDLLTGEREGVMVVPRGEGATSKKAAQRKMRFDVSECKRFACCGNNGGEVFIFDLEKHARVSKLSMPRVRGVVTSCAFAEGCKSVALCTDNSLLWRWDYAQLADTNKPS